MLLDSSARALLEAFSSPEPTPGGGSASALAAALGTSVLVMVARLPKTRHGTPRDRHALDEIAPVLIEARDQLAALVDADAAAYAMVVAARRLPKATPQDRLGRRDALARAIRQAIDVPLGVMRACDTVLAAAEQVALAGTRLAASDLEVGLELVAAGLRGAALNVRINLCEEAAADDAARIERETLALETRAAALAQRVDELLHLQ